MQLRIGIHARATTDLDMIFRGRLAQWLERFDEATANRTWNGFTVSRKGPPVAIDVPGLGYRPWRVGLQLRYEGRDFGSTSLESPSTSRPGLTTTSSSPWAFPALAAFEIDPPRLVPCLDIPHQIAQKLHACTEILPGGNDRVRDIVDIWLLEALLAPEDLPDVRRAVVSTFARRAKQPWPPSVSPSPSWLSDYPMLVAEYPDAPATVEDAVTYLADLILRIDGAPHH